MSDGSIVLTEMFGPHLSKIRADGSKEILAEIHGGPNGVAMGPDGAFYVCNNGGAYTAVESNGALLPGPIDFTRYLGGRIQRVDPFTGDVRDLYTHVDGNPLRAPNQLAFDRAGGMWFTDHGFRHERTSDRTGIYYAKADGTFIKEVVFPCDAPNGIGLAPGDSILYWAETYTGRIFKRQITEPGAIAHTNPDDICTMCLVGLPGMQLLDSFALESCGNVCIATLIRGGITVISPEGEIVDFFPTGDPMTTNICFGGPSGRSAFITLSGTGRLVSTTWPRPGLKLPF